MNSNSDLRSEAIIHEVLDQISNDYISQHIVAPISNAAAKFRYRPHLPITNSEFIRIIGEYTRHMYQHGLRLSRHLSKTQSQFEAISILEENYRNPNSWGYAAAYLDARYSDAAGISFVLSEMTEHITAQARSQHINCIFETRIRSLDWHIKRDLTEMFIQHNHAIFSDSIHNCPSSLLTHQLPELIMKVANADSYVDKVRSAPMSSETNWNMHQDPAAIGYKGSRIRLVAKT